MLLEKCQLRTQLLRFGENNDLVAPNRISEEYAVGDSKTARPNLVTFREVFSPILVEENRELLRYFHFDNSSGEYWVIAHALKHPDYICVMDDYFGRNVCSYFNVKLTGTIGILKKMKERNMLTSDDLECIRQVVKNSRFYLSKDLLRELGQIT
jgi:predicted nucleic acid-binding protein